MTQDRDTTVPVRVASPDDRPPDQVYGSLTEGLHITTYAFERSCSNLEWILQRDRWQKVDVGFTDINLFLETLGLGQLKKSTEQRQRIAKLIKELQPQATLRAIGSALGASHETIRLDLNDDVKKVDKKPARKGGKVDGGHAAKLVAGREKRKARDLKSEAAKVAKLASEAEHIGNVNADIRHGDFREVLADLRDVDAIITDPPYGKDFLPLLADLASFANRVLRPDGVLAVLMGHLYLPQVYRLLDGQRPYRWTACYLTPGPSGVQQHAKVQSKWKPLLIYGGDTRFDDLFRSEGQNIAAKERHEWGQDFGAFSSIVDRLTQPGALVCDPFMGSGTTLVAAVTKGRRAVGCDVDADHVATAQRWLADASVANGAA